MQLINNWNLSYINQLAAVDIYYSKNQTFVAANLHTKLEIDKLSYVSNYHAEATTYMYGK